jgi:hypothetical protein
MSQISMRKGIWVYFDFQSHRIAVHMSVLSGKETVYIDDHPVSDKRNLLSFKGKHAIEVDGQPLTIEIELENPFTFKTEVRIKKGARTLQTQTTHLLTASKNSLMYVITLLAGFVAMGGLTGYLLGKLLVE